MRTFEYFFTRQAVGELDVEDIGNCCIEATNDQGMLYYLVTDTKLGWTRIFEYGPAIPDFDELPKSVYCAFSRIEYDERKLTKKISEFLNSPTREITQAFEVDRDICFSNCKCINDYMENKENF